MICHPLSSNTAANSACAASPSTATTITGISATPIDRLSLALSRRVPPILPTSQSFATRLRLFLTHFTHSRRVL